MGTTCEINWDNYSIYTSYDGYPSYIIPHLQYFVILFGIDRLYEVIKKHDGQSCSQIITNIDSIKQRELTDEWDNSDDWWGEYVYYIDNNYIEGEPSIKRTSLIKKVSQNKIYHNIIINSLGEAGFYVDTEAPPEKVGLL